MIPLNIKDFEAFKKVLELTYPVYDSYELWFKLGHNKFIVCNFTKDGRFEAYHTKGKGKNRIRTALIPDAWNYLSEWSRNNDGGVFYIPTQPQGNPLKSEIAVSDDIAAELDEGTLEEQWQKISEFSQISGLKPSFVIFSGSKSYHIHWKAIGHLPIEQTMYLRRLVCIALNADSAIASNPAQPMRIAGFYRKEKGKEQTLEYWSKSKYSYEEMVARVQAYYTAKNIPFPENLSDERWRKYKRDRRDGNSDLSILTKPEEELYPKPQKAIITLIGHNYTGKIPLELALSKGNQKALEGVDSNRNNTGFALACDLISCYNWLTSNGYAVDGDPYQLFIDYCRACASEGGWNSGEWDSVWRSASRSNPTPARRDLNQFIHWYCWENDPDYRQAAIAEWKVNNYQATAIEPDPAAYQEYLALEAERERIEKAMEESEFLQSLKAKKLGLAKNCRKGFGQYCTKNIDVDLPKTIKYDSDTPLPNPDDYTGLQPPKIIVKKGKRH